MSVLTSQLRRLLRQDPAAEKVLVTEAWTPPQTAVTLRDRLAWDGAPSAALLDRSVDELARAAAEPALVSGRGVLPSTLRVFLLRDLAEDLLLAPEREGYFSDLPSSEGVFRSIAAAVRDLRLAGVRSSGLRPARFVSEAKGRAVRSLLSAYERRLESGGWLDEAGLLREALDAIREGDVRPVPTLALPGALRLRPLEARFLDAYPAERKLLLGWHGDRGVEPGPDRARRRLSGFEDAPAEAAASSAPGAGDEAHGARSGPARPHRAGLLFRSGGGREPARGEVDTAVALGAENEVRSVFRTVVSEAIPLDRVEVAYTDRDRYRSLLLSDAERFGVQCTFAEGLPVELTRAGQALRLFYDWVLDGYDDRVLRRMLRSGLLDFREAELDVRLLPSEAAGLLREAKVGRGRRRYATGLGRLGARVEDRIGRRRSAGRATEALERRRVRIAELERLVDPDRGLLWSFVPPMGAETVAVSDVARRSRGFLEALVARRGRLEPPALESLDARLEEVAGEVEHRMAPGLAVRALRDEMASHPVSRSGPRPGCLHATPLETAAYAGREHLFVVGMDEGAFPGQGLEDPVLLDRERKALSPELALGRRAPSERLYDLSRALGEAEGRVRILSSVRDVSSERELYPSSAFLRAHRVARRDPDAGFEACLRRLAPPAGFTAAGPEATSPAEAWIGRADRSSERYRRGVERRYPGVRRGRVAERHRESAGFTVYDGRVEADASELDPRVSDAVVSPSRLETLVASPHRYFLRYVLGLEPVEELEREPGRWLGPLERGRLLHRLFHAFMSEVTREGERPDPERHRRRMDVLTERLLEQARERIPPPTEAAFRRDVRRIRRTATIFLRDEADRAEEAEPWAFEVRFGDDSAGDGRLESPEPVELELGDAGRLRLRGSIDRIDRLGGDRYRVWDYKTGSTSRYHRVDPLEEGQLQWLLYALALERLLERRGGGGTVVRSGYLFPGDRAHGDRMEYEVGDREVERMVAVLSRHLDLVAEGLFPHPSDAEVCRWCDFAEVCGDPERRSRQVARKTAPGSGPEAGVGDPGGRIAELLRRWRRG